jgi:hypothetical protein
VTSVRYGVCDGSVLGSQRNFPEHVVAAEEREVHAGVAGRFDVGALRPRPVLVVPDRQKYFVVP